MDGVRLLRNEHMQVAIPSDCCYALTFFRHPVLLEEALERPFSYLLHAMPWKVGTSQISPYRWENNMFGRKIDERWRAGTEFTTAELKATWDRWMIPFSRRLSRYKDDISKSNVDHCSFTRLLVDTYEREQSLALLMVPIIIGYPDGPYAVEQEVTKMLKAEGANVVNDKSSKVPRKVGRDEIVLDVAQKSCDIKLPLTPLLQMHRPLDLLSPKPVI